MFLNIDYEKTKIELKQVYNKLKKLKIEINIISKIII